MQYSFNCLGHFKHVCDDDDDDDDGTPDLVRPSSSSVGIAVASSGIQLRR